MNRKPSSNFLHSIQYKKHEHSQVFTITRRRYTFYPESIYRFKKAAPSLSLAATAPSSKYSSARLAHRSAYPKQIVTLPLLPYYLSSHHPFVTLCSKDSLIAPFKIIFIIGKPIGHYSVFIWNFDNLALEALNTSLKISSTVRFYCGQYGVVKRWRVFS